jgi:hypothetical protein
MINFSAPYPKNADKNAFQILESQENFIAISMEDGKRADANLQIQSDNTIIYG